MPKENKKYYIRIGSNSEKEFIYKTISLYSGLITKANLFESAPGMLSSLFLAISSSNLKKEFIIDPVTHVFSYDPYNSGSIRSWQKILRKNAIAKLIDDLPISSESEIHDSWIKEIDNPTSAQKDKVEVLGMKRAYRKLSELIFPEQIKKFIGLRALNTTDFSKELIDEFVVRTRDYQKNILSLSKYNLERYSDFTNELPSPSYILSPYFCISDDEWFNLMTNIWRSFTNVVDETKGALVLHVTLDYLSINIKKIIDELASIKLNNIFLWLNAFSEEEASLENLISYSKLIKGLNDSGKSVFNLYSGGFSIFLMPFGLFSIANGPGYGMDRDAEPVVGGLPTAQYYIPTHHTRLPVADAFNLIQENQLGLNKELFHQQICNCPICQEGIKLNASDMILFYGELGLPTIGIDGVERRFPSQLAHERCKYHFMLSRLIEFRWAQNSSQEDVFNRLNKEIKLWSKNNRHLIDWEESLKLIV